MTTKTLKIIVLLSLSNTINAQNDTIQSNDSIQILEWKAPPFEEKTNLESEQVLSKNSNTILKSENKKQIESFSKTEEIAYNAYVDWVQHCIKTKNKRYSMKLVVGTALAFNINKDELSETSLENKVIELLIKSKSDSNLRNKLFEFYAIEPDDIELYGNFTPWYFNKYTEQQQLAIGVTIGKYIRKNFKYIPETPKQAESETKKQESIKYIAIEKEAVFKGGDKKLQEYIFQNLNIPESAQNFSGKVNVSFVIIEDGSIDNISIKPNVPNELQTEIERVFKNMPNWTPAQSQGKNIKMKKSFPLTFR